MAFTVTSQGGGANNTGTILSVNPTSNIAGGSLIVVVAGTLDTIRTLSDTAGNTYTLAKSSSTGGRQAAIWYCLAATALTTASSITYTKTTNNAAIGMSVLSATYTGVLSLDLSIPPTVGNSTAPSITSGTASASGELFIGAVGAGHNSGGTFTQASGWSNCLTFEAGAGVGSAMGGFQVNAGTGALTYNPTISTSFWNAFILSFNAVASGTVMRRNLSQLGGRTGSRQPIGFTHGESRPAIHNPTSAEILSYGIVGSHHRPDWCDSDRDNSQGGGRLRISGWRGDRDCQWMVPGRGQCDGHQYAR